MSINVRHILVLIGMFALSIVFLLIVFTAACYVPNMTATVSDNPLFDPIPPNGCINNCPVGVFDVTVCVRGHPAYNW